MEIAENLVTSTHTETIEEPREEVTITEISESHETHSTIAPAFVETPQSTHDIVELESIEVTTESELKTSESEKKSQSKSESKFTLTEEERRLREEVKKSFQKAAQGDVTCHIRIDNFQRPLTLRTLSSWLEEKLNMKLLDSNIWLNGIKTHCYVTFENIDDSKRAKEIIEGMKYPLSNPLTLVVHYTSLSAQQATKSPEANLKLSDWKISVSLSVPVPIIKRLGSGNSKTLNLSTKKEIITGNETIASPVLGKRKGLAPSAGIGGAMFGVLRNTLHDAAAANAQEHSTKSPRHERTSTPRTAPVLNHTLSIDSSSGQAEYFTEAAESANHIEVMPVQRKRLVVESEKKQLNKMKPVEHQQKGLSLDDFFKKTLVTPQLYWLPVSEEEAQRRKSQKKGPAK